MPERHSSGTWLYGKKGWLTGTYEEEAGVLECNFNACPPNAAVKVDFVDFFIEDVVDAGKEARLFIELTVDDEVEGLIGIGFIGIAFIVVINPLFPNGGIPARLFVIVVGELQGRDVVGNAVDTVG